MQSVRAVKVNRAKMNHRTIVGKVKNAALAPNLYFNSHLLRLNQADKQ